MEKLVFGTAGIPFSTKNPSTLTGVQRVAELGLGAMELEFVYSINLDNEKAKQVKKVAEENNVELTCHGSFYINLNSLERAKVHASVNRILKSADIANKAGAKSLTFHPAFYLKNNPKEVYDKVKFQLGEISSVLKSFNNKIIIRPETTGKATQFGSLEEIVELSKELNQVLPCIDFSHLHARTGKMNSEKEWREMFSYLEKELGKNFLKNLHCHLSGIEYTAKGERKHLMLDNSDMQYKSLLKVIKDFDCAGVIICESPNPQEDALLLKKYYSSFE
jgi:deoxyribonuclease IV